MANTGFIVAGHCAASTTEALTIWASQFPLMANNVNLSNGLVYPASAVINTTGKITYTLKYDNGTAVVTNANEQLLSCDPAFDPDPFSLAAALAAFSFFFGTMLLFFFWSKSTGVIIEKVKRPLGHG